jgi:hypothetical protein
LIASTSIYINKHMYSYVNIRIYVYTYTYTTHTYTCKCIIPGNPFAPHAKCSGMVKLALSPIDSWTTPRSISTFIYMMIYTNKH